MKIISENEWDSLYWDAVADPRAQYILEAYNNGQLPHDEAKEELRKIILDIMGCLIVTEELAGA